MDIILSTPSKIISLDGHIITTTYLNPETGEETGKSEQDVGEFILVMLIQQNGE